MDPKKYYISFNDLCYISRFWLINVFANEWYGSYNVVVSKGC